MSNTDTRGLSRESTRGGAAARAGASGPVSSALYLAWREVRRTWRAGLWAVVLASAMGIGAAFLLTEGFGADSTEGSFTIPLVNLVFLLWAGVLPRLSAWQPGGSGGGAPASISDGHLAFLRSLPLTVPRIVAARALVSVFSVLVLSTAFFAPLYLFSEPSGAQFGMGGYLLFAAFWAGCALAFEAAGLLTELVMGSTAGFLSYLVLITTLGGLVGAGVDVVGAVAGLVEHGGAVPALAALTVGGVALVLSGMATARRLRRREAAG